MQLHWNKEFNRK